jgi:segregation and condensation protein A
LVQIKSEALLPRPPEREEGEEDPAESLARQLKIYRAVKATSKWLHNREAEGLHAYIRLAPPPVIEEELDLTGVTVDNLVAMLQSLYRFQEEAAPITSVVTIPKVTIKNKIKELLGKLQQQTKLSYRNMLPAQYDRIEAIVLFLAILEMVKQRYAVAEQSGLFSDIDISPTDKNFDEDEIVLALED